MKYTEQHQVKAHMALYQELLLEVIEILDLKQIVLITIKLEHIGWLVILECIVAFQPQ